MARFHGVIGYGSSVENPSESGIWVDNITERPYFGDVERNARRSEPGENLNNDIKVQNTISVVADDHAYNHFHEIKYIMWEGIRWTVSNVEVNRPRLKIYLGTPYNGPIPPPPPDPPDPDDGDSEEEPDDGDSEEEPEVVDGD